MSSADAQPDAPLADYERRFAEFCLSATPSEELAASLTGDRERMFLYRQMVRGRLAELAGNALPRTQKALGIKDFQVLFERFLDVSRPTSRFLREVAMPFAGWLEKELRTRRTDAPWLAELVRFEAAWWQALWLDAPLPTNVAPFDFEHPVVLGPLATLVELSHTVHEDPLPDGTFARRDVAVIVYRGLETHTVGTFALNDVMAAIVRGFRDAPGIAAKDVVARVAGSRGIAVDAAFIEGLCGVLESFLERGIVLGSRPLAS